MVQRRRKIVWTVEALLTKKAIFKYWNNRNKSIVFSQKLNTIFKEELYKIVNFPARTFLSYVENVKLPQLIDNYLVNKVLSSKITILEIWDTRQNPQDFPIK